MNGAELLLRLYVEHEQPGTYRSMTQCWYSDNSVQTADAPLYSLTSIQHARPRVLQDERLTYRASVELTELSYRSVRSWACSDDIISAWRVTGWNRCTHVIPKRITGDGLSHKIRKMSLGDLLRVKISTEWHCMSLMAQFTRYENKSCSCVLYNIVSWNSHGFSRRSLQNCIYECS